MEQVNVLLVDDNAQNRLVLGSVLAELGENVVLAESGREALRCLLRQQFAVVLLDVNMPGLDGFETAALIRQRESSAQTPIIFITAFGDDTHSTRGYSLGAVDYLISPVVPEVLRTKVAVFVELFRKNEEGKRQAILQRRRAERLERLGEISLAINAAPTLPQIVELTTAAARELFGEAEVVESPSTGSAAPGGRAAATPAGQGRIYVEVKSELGEDAAALVSQLGQVASLAAANVLSKEALEANRLKDEFLSNLSHELRGPLNAILGWSHILDLTAPDSENWRRGLEAIQRNAQLQSHLIEDLLDVARIVSGKLRISPRTTRLLPLVEMALDVVRPQAAAQETDLRLTLGPGVDPQLRLRADPDRLQQVVLNLLGNALKFTPERGRVTLHVAVRAGEIDLVVSDTGQGIEPSFLPLVFDRLRQGDETGGRVQGGLGLGLAIVEHIVELHGGTVRAESDGAGRGATFTVTLPVGEVEDEAAEDAAQEDARDPVGQGERLAELEILVVDDQADARELSATALRQAGARVETAGSMREALEILSSRQPHVLVSDIAMSGGDGYELLQRVRRLEAKGTRPIPALAVTAHAQLDDRRRALASGFDEHLPKPVEPTDLVAAVARLAARDAA